MGARVAVEAAGVAVRVTVTLAVAVTTPLAVALVVRAMEDVVVLESEDAPVAVTVAAAGVKKTVVLT
jgi:hypothetical protein